MRNIVVGLMITIGALLSNPSWATNGMPIELAPSTELSDLATQAVGALMREKEFEDTDKTMKEVSYSRGNVTYIGDSPNGSLLLVHANHVTTNGKENYEALENMRLMFGPAVTDLRVGRLERVFWYPQLGNSKIHLYEAFKKNKDTKDALAIIEMPVHFAAPRRPVELIEVNAALPHRGLFYSVGMGSDSMESTDAKASLSPFESMKTSGKLRLAGMRLDNFFLEAVMRLSPYPAADWKAIHESEFPDDGMVDGPCEYDGGAPLFMEASQLAELNGEKVVKEKIVLVGIHYANANTCIRKTSDPAKEPLVADINLAKPEIQKWIRSFFRK